MHLKKRAGVRYILFFFLLLCVRIFHICVKKQVLVALSHGWFYQTHPDPEGDKLNLIQKQFAPKLRERFPGIHIALFPFQFHLTCSPKKSFQFFGFIFFEDFESRRVKDHLVHHTHSTYIKWENLLKMCGTISEKYYQYTLTTGVYMLDPWERYLFNVLIVGSVSLTLYYTAVLSGFSIADLDL